MTSEARELVDHLFRNRAGQMVAWLTRAFGPAHLELAEEVVQDALVKALQQWPFSGIPDNPVGWLFRVARNGALDALRRDVAFRGRTEAIAAELGRAAPAGPPIDDDALRDDELRLMFLCCHPALPGEASVALSLKTVAGFGVGEIARALLSSEAAIAQRLVRAKRQLREANVTFELPSGSELTSRLDAVLEVLYLIFNEGYSAYAGDNLVRLDLCGESLRLARLVAGAPATASPAADALTALIAFQAARLPARVDEAGEVVLLEDQDRALWDQRLITLGFTHLDRSATGPAMTPYHVQAAIAAAHAAARPWAEILALYDDLLALQPSPIVVLNRAVALSKVAGPRAALEAIRAIETSPALAHYYLLGAVKGRLLVECGEREEAARWLRAALEQPCSEPERRLLNRRLVEVERR